MLKELRNFSERFKVFDKDLRSSIDEEKLKNVRERIENHLNPMIEQSGYRIQWPVAGGVYDEDIHRSEDDSGQTIVNAKTAVIYRSVDGKFKCETKATVSTR